MEWNNKNFVEVAKVIKYNLKYDHIIKINQDLR